MNIQNVNKQYRNIIKIVIEINTQSKALSKIHRKI